MRFSTKCKAIACAALGAISLVRTQIKTIQKPSAHQISSNRTIKSITLVGLLLTIFYAFKGWFKQLSVRKKIICAIVLVLLISALLSGMFPIVLALIKFILLTLKLIIFSVAFSLKVLIYLINLLAFGFEFVSSLV